MSEDEIIVALQQRVLTSDLRADTKHEPPPLYPTVTSDALASAEKELGLRFPPLLSRLYREVANGGFGPGGGLLGLRGGHVDSSGQTLVDVYTSFREEGWAKPLLPLWEWGGPAWSCVDTRSADGRIVTEDESGCTLTRFVLRSWLEAWLNGTDLLAAIYEMKAASIINPFTGKSVATRRQGRAIGTPVSFPEDEGE